MQAALHISTRIPPGKRLEILAPELEEGTDVEVFIIARAPQSATQNIPFQPSRTMLDFLNTLPAEPSPRAFETWEEYEQFLQQEKSAWDR